MERTEGVSARFMRSQNSKPWNKPVCHPNPQTFGALLLVAVRTALVVLLVAPHPFLNNPMPKTLLERGSPLCHLHILSGFPARQVYWRDAKSGNVSLNLCRIRGTYNFFIGLRYKFSLFVLQWDSLYFMVMKKSRLPWPNTCMKKKCQGREGRRKVQGTRLGHLTYVSKVAGGVAIS